MPTRVVQRTQTGVRIETSLLKVLKALAEYTNLSLGDLLEEAHNALRCLAVDRDPAEPVKNVLNRQILEMSTSLALTEHSEVHIVHAWEVFGESLLRSHKWDFTEAEFKEMLEEEAAAIESAVDTVIKAGHRV